MDQTMQDFEILIVDDASGDNAAEVLNLWAARDPRIQTFQLTENSGGAAKPKNVALAHASGEFVATLDADDEWMPDKLEKQLAVFERHSEVGFVGCNEWVVDERGKTSVHKISPVGNVLERILQSDYMGGGSCSMYRASVLRATGPFDEHLRTGQDWDMRIRLAQQTQFAFVEGAPLIRRYLHDGNISKLSMEKRQKDVDYLEEKFRALYEVHPRVYSNKLRFNGTRFILAGERVKAWRAFVQSIKQYPANGLSWVYLGVSLMGPRVYKFATSLKQRIGARNI